MRNFTFCLLFISVFSGFDLKAQQVILNSFTAVERQGKVFLDWEISSGFTCNGTVILRATDTIHFEAIGEIEGICGSTTEAIPYDFTDHHPIVNQTNYYRLRLGDTELSPIRKVEVTDLGQDGYQVRPNPLSSQGKVFFSNPTRNKHVLRIYDSKGAPMLEYPSNEDHFDIDVRQLPPGTYLFNIMHEKENETVAKGKLLVQR